MAEFGLRITSPEEQKEIQARQKKFAMPESDGSTNVYAGGHYSYVVDMDSSTLSDNDLILKYREIASQMEVDRAVNDIVNEAIVFDDEGKCVDLNLDKVESWNENVKKQIRKEFEYILRKLDFKNKGYDIFRNWYVDGRIYYHCVLDAEDPHAGVKELDFVDPTKIKKIREIKKTKDAKTGVELISSIDEYFIFSESGLINSKGQGASGIKIAPDAVVYIPSGILNPKRTAVVSYLHKAIKPFNQLRMVEDSQLIYRMARAPERRLFYIDVGTMSTAKANQYIRSLQQNFRNKLVYDAQTGEIKDDRKFMSMLEDFWLPRREGGKGTEISTLQGAGNLGEISDIEYFKKNLYNSLNIPVSRLESTQGFSLGKTTEITRDELSFSKFIKKLRNQFSKLFDDVLEKHLVLKGIVTTQEWKRNKDDVWYDFLEDIYFDDIKEAELLRDRLDILGIVDVHVGKYFPKDWVMKNVLKFTDDEIKELTTQMDKEKSAGIIPDPMDPEQGGWYGQSTADTARKTRPSASPAQPDQPSMPINANTTQGVIQNG